MNKLLYKIELCLVKVIPMIYALLSLLNTTLSYFNIEAVMLSYIGSVSFITLLLLYITPYVFKFCEYHRMFIHYTTVTWILNIIDLYIGIPCQYHDYAELFKNWFGDGIEQKIVESAIVFWFKDADCKAENKVVEYLGEY